MVTTIQRPMSRSHIAAVLLGLLGVIGLLAAPLSGAADPSPTPSPQEQSDSAGAALDWITTELNSGGGTMPGFSPGTSDWGLTADAILALVAGGRADSAAARTATDQLTAAADEYTTWASAMPEVRVAGATAKVLLVLRAIGRSPIVGEADLESELRMLMATSGDQIGRFNDRVPDPTWNAANAFGQALAMLALAYAPEGMPDESVDFLISQQCPSGGFPLTYATGGCPDDTSADTDASAISIQALLSANRTNTVNDAIVKGLSWLLSIQDPATGAFGGTGPTAGLNSNSTGLITQTLRAAGAVGAADRAAGWVMGKAQLTDANATGTPAADYIGAIAYNSAALDAALTEGLTEKVVDQWRRASTQAVLALGLPVYGPGDIEPVPIPTTTTTSTTSSNTTPSTSSSTSTTTATDADHDGSTTDPDPAPTTTGALSPDENDPRDPWGVGVEGLDDADPTLGVGAKQTDTDTVSQLPRTGSDPTYVAILGLGLVLAGVVLGAARRAVVRR